MGLLNRLCILFKGLHSITVFSNDSLFDRDSCVSSISRANRMLDEQLKRHLEHMLHYPSCMSIDPAINLPMEYLSDYSSCMSIDPAINLPMEYLSDYSSCMSINPATNLPMEYVSDYSSYMSINPATGLPMISGDCGVDVGGNPYGVDLSDNLHQDFGYDSTCSNFDNHNSFF